MERCFFPKTNRIRKRSEFLSLAHKGKRIENRFFIAVYVRDRGGVSRLGLTTTKRVGCSPVRNRIKRYVREYFRQNKQRMAGRYDVNIIAKRGAATLTAAGAFSALSDLFERMQEDTRH